MYINGLLSGLIHRSTALTQQFFSVFLWYILSNRNIDVLATLRM